MPAASTRWPAATRWPRWRPSWAWTIKIGVVLGDDLSARAGELRERGITEMFSGAPFPQKLASINAYLGALPIARALDAGADVVITGRCVDSAVTLGVLVHEFGWTADQYDHLAQGTLAGHLVECGAQCNGGLFTDWESVPDWDIIGFPIVEAQSRRQLRHHQDRRHGRAGDAGDGGRADALRDRRPARLPRARRGLRLHRRALRAGGHRTACASPAPGAGRRPTPTRSAPPSWMASATWPS